MSQIRLGRSPPNNHLPCGISAKQREANSGFNAGLICSSLKLFKSFVTCPSKANESTPLLTSLFKSTLSGSFPNITASSESGVWRMMNATFWIACYMFIAGLKSEDFFAAFSWPQFSGLTLEFTTSLQFAGCLCLSIWSVLVFLGLTFCPNVCLQHVQVVASPYL